MYFPVVRFLGHFLLLFCRYIRVLYFLSNPVTFFFFQSVIPCMFNEMYDWEISKISNVLYDMFFGKTSGFLHHDYFEEFKNDTFQALMRHI
jgi:hypothetical protein